MDIGGDHEWVPFFTHTSRAFGMISLWDWVRELGLSNLLEKLFKHVVNAPIIFLTSITLGSPFWPLVELATQVPLSFLGPLDLWSVAFFNALNLWQLGLVCPCNPQKWQKWFVLGPHCDLGSDLPLASNLASDWLRDLLNTRWSATFFFLSTFYCLCVKNPKTHKK